MPRILLVSASNTLFAASQYPRSASEVRAMGLIGARNEEMRALTIAAFRVAQNNSQLSTRSMNAELLLFLVAGSTSALNHWVSKGRLSKNPSAYSLTPVGLAECQNTLLGLSGTYSTTEAKVQEWVRRLVHGDHVAMQRRTFPSGAWPAQ